MSVTPLDRVADVLVETHADQTTVGASLVRLVQPDDAPDDVELGLLPLDDHPAEYLKRFTAPPSWLAIGIVAGGWAAPIGGVRPSAHPEGRRVLNVVLVDRAGTVVSRIRLPDGTVLREVPAYGAVLDGLRGALGLPRAA